MESKKAKQYCQVHNLHKNFDDTYFGETIIIVEMAEKEMKEKAIEAHRKSCPYLDDEICAGQSDVVTSSKIDEKCLGKCEYVELFTSLINKKS